MNYHEITCESALHKLKRKIPFAWDLNLYRGCEHRCRYCFAIYSHRYLDSGDFFGDIFAKSNILEKLEKELASPNWKREIVSIGGVTDSYQPWEQERKIMPEVLKLFIRYRTPVIISTKSDLIMRDLELIDELSHVAMVNIAATITTVDEELAAKLEPGAVSSKRRFAMLKAMRDTNACTGLHVMPILPYLTDNRNNMEGLFAGGRDAGVDYVLPGTLYLRGQTRSVFMNFIAHEFPELLAQYQKLYATGGAGKAYKDELYKMVHAVRDAYHLSGSYMAPLKKKMNELTEKQLTFL